MPCDSVTLPPLTANAPSALLESSNALLDAYAANPDSESVAQSLSSFRRDAAAAIAALPPKEKNGSEVKAALALVKRLSDSGCHDERVTDTDVALANTHRAQGWTGLLAAMTLTPAWQWTAAPKLEDVPLWLLPEYAAYRFTVPTVLTSSGQAAACTLNFIGACNELTQLVRANRGSLAVRSAISAYEAARVLPPDWTGSLWPQFALARQRLREVIAGRVSTEESLMLPRGGRRLRVGFVTDALSANGAQGSMIPLVERLDSARFEPLVYVIKPETDSPAARHLRGSGAEIVSLANEVDNALQTLRSALLDVAVFVVDPGANADPVAGLASHRVAGLQVIHDGLESSWGGAAIDLCLGGLARPELSTRIPGPRPGLLPGVGALGCGALPAPAPAPLTRELLGLPEGGFLFACLTSSASLTPEVQETCSALLSRAPGSSLVICLSDGPLPAENELRRLGAQFSSRLARQGVAENRLMIVPHILESQAARKSFLCIADAALGTGGMADSNTALAAAEAAVPFLAMDNPSLFDHRAAGMLRLARVDELAVSPPAIPEIGARLAKDQEWRIAIRARWETAAPGLLARHDSFAQSESFGRLLELAFDEICVSRKRFSTNLDPLRVPGGDQVDMLLSEAEILMDSGLTAEAENRARQVLALRPEVPGPRQLLARIATERGAHAEASAHLLTCIELEPENAVLWREFAASAARAGRTADALTAIQSALRLDPQQIDTWLLLAKLGDQPMIAQVADMLRQLAPEDPRVKDFLARHAA